MSGRAPPRGRSTSPNTRDNPAKKTKTTEASPPQGPLLEPWKAYGNGKEQAFTVGKSTTKQNTPTPQPKRTTPSTTAKAAASRSRPTATSGFNQQYDPEIVDEEDTRKNYVFSQPDAVAQLHTAMMTPSAVFVNPEVDANWEPSHKKPTLISPNGWDNLKKDNIAKYEINLPKLFSSYRSVLSVF